LYIFKYILKRLFYGIFVIVGISILIFLITRVMPGDSARMALGGRVSESKIEEFRDKLHLNEPLINQYLIWAKDLLNGDLGYSLRSRRKVSEDIKELLPATIELTIYAALFVGIMGFSLGALAGWHKGSWVDNLVRLISYIGVCTPNYVWAIFFVLVFTYIFPLLPSIGRISDNVVYSNPITGLITLDAIITGNFTLFFDSLKHILLPAFSLSMASMAVQARVYRSSFGSNLEKEYIWSARSNGIPKNLIIFKYLAKPSLAAGITLYGHGIGKIMTGAFLVESIFNWPGLARYSLNAIYWKDINSIQAIIVFYGIVFIMLNLIVDLLVMCIDPRIRLLDRSR